MNFYHAAAEILSRSRYSPRVWYGAWGVYHDRAIAPEYGMENGHNRDESFLQIATKAYECDAYDGVIVRGAAE